MPKITVHGGPSNEATDGGYDPDNLVTPEDGGDPYTLDDEGTRHYEPMTLTGDGSGTALPVVDEGAGGATIEGASEQEARELYESQNVEALKAELKARNRDLSTTGKKPELVDRLLEDDAAQATAAADAAPSGD